MNTDKQTIKSFNDYFQKQIRLIFFVCIVIFITGNFLDILILKEKRILYFNSASILIFLLSIILHLRFRVPLNICFGLCLYTLIINLILSLALHQRDDSGLLMFLRESIFMVLLMILSGLFINRVHIVIIYLILTADLFFEAFLHRHAFLLQNLPILFVVYSALLFVMYFFVSKLHDAISENQRKRNDILEKNEKLENGTQELMELMEELREKNKTLQELNVSKDKFFAILSHDLRNPLNAMQGFTEILINRHDTLDQEKRMKYYRNIWDSCEKTTGLLNQLLEWSRSQSNILQCEPVSFQIRELAESVCYYLKNMADAKKIQLNNIIRENQLVFADYNMIFTVLRNFISNAVKFSFRESGIEIFSSEENGNVTISIRDHGVGIEKDIADKLFSFGNSYTTPGTDRETGSGLGLVLCKELIDKNNGSLGLVSVPGEGSTFWFSLPKGSE